MRGGRRRRRHQGQAGQAAIRPAARPSRSISTATTSCRCSKGEATTSPRKEFVYFDDDGNLVAYRDERFKYNFAVQYAKGMEIWRNPMMTLRAPIIIDLKSDPFEYAADGSIHYERWLVDHAFLMLPAVDKVATYLATYKNFPPRQRPASFSIDQVLDKINAAMKVK